ncbi:hypothetical protein CRD60_02430 [Bifidobacterium aemilianum]|uniref:Uncharacterized protein n=1 Tax=Bifidobacterium aemilianum TaxID=2493120 RepID=A0A366K8I1_9BIFI|nr:hypothetical protein CRD60_02430 [Bifidobacterium aemilianum]
MLVNLQIENLCRDSDKKLPKTDIGKTSHVQATYWHKQFLLLDHVLRVSLMMLFKPLRRTACKEPIGLILALAIM